jgi:rfaE bifunctional protein nucleotidyltransferase chain/domain
MIDNAIQPHSLWKELYQKKVIDPKKLTKKVEALRSDGKTICSLNGSFDILHAGHLHCLYEASTQGDIFIVAVNTDRSIQEYKSLNRPIIELDHRMQMLAALSFVDYVTYFNEPDPRNILELIKPDCHSNGAEYGSKCIEAITVKKYGGSIHIIDLVPGLSTSSILKKIRSTCD